MHRLAAFVLPLFVLAIALSLSGCAAVSFEHGVNQIQLAVYHPLCIDVEGASTAPGARVQVYACGPGKRSQEWTVKPASATNAFSANGEFMFENANSKLCMSVAANVNDQYPAQPVIQAPCDYTDPDMLWKILPAPGGMPGFNFVSAASSQCLDLPYGAIASIFDLQEYFCTKGDPAQGWTINPVSLGSTP